MYSTVSSLQDLLSAKEAKALDKSIHLAALQCLAILCEKHGQKLASSMLETLTIAAKYSGRLDDHSCSCSFTEMNPQMSM